MSQVGNIAGRSTSLAVSDALLSALRRSQTGLTKAQQEISTGKAVEKPSDAPSKIASILLLQGNLAQRVQQGNNLQNAGATLDTTDQSLGDVTDLLLEAKAVASSQVGVGSNTDTRKNQATVIDAQLQSLLDIANRRYQGVSLFGGSVQDEQLNPFESFLGGVRYRGGQTNLDRGRHDRRHSQGLWGRGARYAQYRGFFELRGAVDQSLAAGLMGMRSGIGGPPCSVRQSDHY